MTTRLAPLVLALIANIAAYGDTIRVGTPGDYRPFSYALDGGNDRRGVDVDIVRAFAADQNHRIEWVTTSWPSLRADTVAARFDFAIGGISRNADRLKAGSMTATYFVTGKTILRRCTFDVPVELDRLNQSAHRVIVNPGGTNERFVHRHLAEATVTVHTDNLSVFRTLAEGPYDFMVTDAVEAEIEAARHEALCIEPGHRFDRVEKAYFGPRANPYLAAIDAWLRTHPDEVRRIFEAHGL